MIKVEFRKGALGAYSELFSPIPKHGTKQQFVCNAYGTDERWEFENDEAALRFIKECQDNNIRIKVLK